MGVLKDRKEEGRRRGEKGSIRKPR